jgi:formiminoglutamase
MNTLIIYKKKSIEKYISKREGETKFGESVLTIQYLDELKTTPAKYVLLGIPEDIGVLANCGIPGTRNAWKSCLKSLLNIQANTFTTPENILLLGEVDCESQLKAAETLDKEDEHYYEELGNIVSQIDKKVTAVVEQIMKAGKIPIIIGGGHNNSYGIIRGTSYALQKPISVINFDAHSDFRPLENRHSGNGFSYAYEEGFLNHYFIFGLQKQYNSQSVLDRLHSNKETIAYSLFDQIAIDGTKSFGQALKEAESFTVATEKFGLEMDLDSIQDIPSSAKTPSGFAVNDARRFISYFAKNDNVAYLHLCEAAPKPGTDEEKQVGKLLAYLIVDFIS